MQILDTIVYEMGCIDHFSFSCCPRLDINEKTVYFSNGIIIYYKYKMSIRFDLIFSNWMFVWFILYWFQFTQYNPKAVFIVGVFENVITVILAIYYRTHAKYILYFLGLIVFLKVFLLYLIWNTRFLMKDAIATILVTLVYVTWLHWNNTNVVDLYRKVVTSVIKEKNETPILGWIHELGLV